MITYNQAFDLYHSIFRMAHILERIGEDESFEIDKVRIWDFYMLFPDKIYTITIRKDEEDLRKYRSTFIKKENNPYEFKGDSRKLFEWIKPFQMSALNCLVSCGILKKDAYLSNRVCVAGREALDAFLKQADEMSVRESNVLSFLSLLSRNMPLTGSHGLKARTRLLESKYDAE